MKEKKQIDTLKNDLMKSEFWRFDDESGRFELDRQNTARNLYKKGYRMASEVAAEIFEEIEKKIADLEYQAKTPRKTVKVEELKAQMNWILHEVIPQIIAELKQKYTNAKDTNVLTNTEGENGS